MRPLIFLIAFFSFCSVSAQSFSEALTVQVKVNGQIMSGETPFALEDELELSFVLLDSTGKVFREEEILWISFDDIYLYSSTTKEPFKRIGELGRKPQKETTTFSFALSDFRPRNTLKNAMQERGDKETRYYLSIQNFAAIRSLKQGKVYRMSDRESMMGLRMKEND